MCHIALILPLLALPMLLILPLAVSGPIYAFIALVSGAIYWYAVLVMRRPVATGTEGMIGTTGSVVESRGHSLVVTIGGEIWNGRSSIALREGDRVKVVAVERLVLVVEPTDRTAFSARDNVPAVPAPDFRTADPAKR